MAHRDSFSHNGEDANSISGSFPLGNTRVQTPTINNSPVIVEDKPTMSITNVTKIIRDVLPPISKVSDDSKELVQECSSKFISYMTKKAKERCKTEYRKIMKDGDLFWAFESVGLAYYIAPLKLYLRRYRLEGNRNRDELVPPIGLIQNTNNNWLESGSGSGSGSGSVFVPESVPVQSVVPSVEIPQPSLPASPITTAPDFSIDASSLDMFDLDEFLDGFGHSYDFNFDDIFLPGDDDKRN